MALHLEEIIGASGNVLTNEWKRASSNVQQL